MTETKTRSQARTKKEVKEEAVEPTLDDQIALLDVPKSVERTLKHPETDEERTYIQHELGFLPKLKFFRLLSGTVRLATENDAGGVNAFVGEAFAGGELSYEGFAEMFMKLIELAPEFLDEAYVLILKVPGSEQQWALEALQEIDDETGIDIIDTFLAQNGKALSDFFTKHLARLQKRATVEFGNLVTEQESETTT